ncbi:unnamed protein product [Pleuronectes platessa]|uniref:Uncharacterized protein n=1 Tax=Pleuronectes platessa TaxID=8262 RepID=A0A9N7YF06_PLEPL|nr:unnamed protein product [Pleuronectes platessa]
MRLDPAVPPRKTALEGRKKRRRGGGEARDEREEENTHTEAVGASLAPNMAEDGRISLLLPDIKVGLPPPPPCPNIALPPSLLPSFPPSLLPSFPPSLPPSSPPSSFVSVYEGQANGLLSGDHSGTAAAPPPLVRAVQRSECRLVGGGNPPAVGGTRVSQTDVDEEVSVGRSQRQNLHGDSSGDARGAREGEWINWS